MSDVFPVIIMKYFVMNKYIILLSALAAFSYYRAMH